MPARAHKPTPETRAQAAALASYGVKTHEIAAYLGISEDTLRRKYSADMESARTDRNGTVAKFLFHAASGKAIDDGATYADCLRAAMFWAKTRMGWREVERVEESGAQPMAITFREIK